MKTLLSSLAVVLLCSMSVFAQRPIQDSMPLLQEWWRAPANEENLGVAVGWLPNFYNGRDAMAITTKNGTETWLNRFPGDRENIFTWKGAPPIVRGDFNGDGITDYIDQSGNVYRGKQKGEPPEAVPVLNIGSLITKLLVMDVNKDGFDDLVVLSMGQETPSLVTIYFGSENLSQMKRYQVMRSVLPIPNDTSRYYAQLYKTHDGNIRIISMYNKRSTQPPPYRDGFELFGLEWDKSTQTANGSKLGDYLLDSPGGILKWQFNYAIGFEAIYQSTHHDKTFLLAVSYNNDKITVFDVSRDTLVVINEISVERCYYIIPLTHSIDGDIYEDFAIRQFGGASTTISFYSGGTSLATKPFAYYKPACDNPPTQVISISDVTNDGIADIALGIEPYKLSNCFRLVKSPSPVDVQEKSDTITEFSLSGTTPHPVTNHALLKSLIKNKGNYLISLLSLDGTEIQELFSGYLENGECSISLNFANVSISSGTYLIRMADNKGQIVGQRTAIITK